MRASVALVVAMLSCKRELDADYTKRNMIERTVVVSAMGASVTIRTKLPEGLEAKEKWPGWFEPKEPRAAPSVHFYLRDAGTAPKTTEEMLRVHDRAGPYVGHDLDDGLITTNTDFNYYTDAIRRFPGLQTPSGMPLVFACEVEYREASGLAREREVTRWMERICTDLTMVK
jgi:hypothetical protein